MSEPTDPRLKTGLTQPNPQGLLDALELMDLGFQLRRQRFVRENQGATPEEIDKMLNEWIMTPRSQIKG